MKKKFKITLKGTDNLILITEGIKQDNTYKYLEKDLIVLISLEKNKINIKRNNSEYTLKLNLELKKKTISTYEFSGGNKIFDLNTYTEFLKIDDRSIQVKYKLEDNNFEFKLEVIE